MVAGRGRQPETERVAVGNSSGLSPLSVFFLSEFFLLQSLDLTYGRYLHTFSYQNNTWKPTEGPTKNGGQLTMPRVPAAATRAPTSPGHRRGDLFFSEGTTLDFIDQGRSQMNVYKL